MTASDSGTANPIKDCLAGLEAPRLAVQFLVDESGSLRKSDPKAERVNAIKAALAALSFNLETNEELPDAQPLKIAIRLAGFSKEFKADGKEWTELSAESIADLDRQVEGFAARQDGKFTNYERALTGAEREFVEYSRATDGPLCKVLVWLTDGNLDLDDSSNPGPEERQKKRLCTEADSVVNRLRSQQVFVVGLGLSSDTKPDFGLMRTIIEGGCGDKQAFGKFTEVSGSDGLVTEMFKNLLPGADGQDPVPCEGEETNDECREVRFGVRHPLTRVNALVGLAPGIDSGEVIDPSSTSVAFATAGKTLTVESGFLKSRSSFAMSTVLRVDVKNRPGTWRIRFRGPGADDAIVIPVFFSDVTVSVEGLPLRVDRNRPDPIRVNIGNLGLDGLETDEAVSDFDSPPTVSASLTAGQLTLDVRVEPGERPGQFSLLLNPSQLSTIASAGSLALTPVASLNGRAITFDTTVVPVVFKVGDGFAVIKRVSSTPVDGSGTSTLTVEVEGPEEGVGRVQILGSTLEVEDVPAGRSGDSARLTVDDASEASVKAGATGSVVAEISPGFAANGRFVGTVVIELTNEAGETQRATVPVSFDMTKPFDVSSLLKWLILMLVVFGVVQAIALWLAADRLSRIGQVPAGTWYATMTIRLKDGEAIEPVLPSSWDQVSDLAERVAVDRVSGKRMASFGSFQIAGSSRDALKSLFLGSAFTLGVSRGLDVVVSTDDPSPRRDVAGGIRANLARQWAMAFSSGTTLASLEGSEVESFDDGVFGAGVESFKPSLTVDVLYFIPDYNSLTREDVRDMVRDSLEYADLWGRIKNALREIQPPSPEVSPAAPVSGTAPEAPPSGFGSDDPFNPFR